MLNKKHLLSVLFVVIFIMVVGVTMFEHEFNAHASNPRIHKNEFPEYGVLIVNSMDATYENDVRESLRDKIDAFQEVAATLRPFSVFVKNTSNKDILAYKLNWELKMSDGRVINYPRTYFSPAYLMGVPRSDLYDSMMESIKKNSKRFFTVIKTPFETDGGGGSGSGVIAMKIEKSEVERFQEASRTNDVNPFISKVTEQLNQATDITVSVESVLFDDGSFVGPSGDEEFVKLKASITAKHDLLKTISGSVNRERIQLDEVFTLVARIADQDVPVPTPGSAFGVYYNFFRKLQAQEIMSSRRAVGNDTKAISIFLHRLDHKWIIPFEQTPPGTIR